MVGPGSQMVKPTILSQSFDQGSADPTWGPENDRDVIGQALVEIAHRNEPSTETNHPMILSYLVPSR